MARSEVSVAPGVGLARVIDSSLTTVETLRLSDGRALCARRWAGSGAEVLVVLHGLLDSSEGWSAVGERVPCTQVAFDLPGFGYSDAPRRGSIAEYAHDVAEGLALLGVERFTLVGHSLGGAVATALAELLPDRVAALVLLAPAGFGRLHLAEAISLPGVRNLVEAALPLALGSRLAVTAGYMTMVANGRVPERALVERVTSRGAGLVDGAREGTRAVVNGGRGRDAFYRRRVAYRGPVFAVWGEEDRLVPVSHRHGVLTAFPHARIEVWPGVGHHLVRERFDKLLTAICESIEAGSPRASRQRLVEGG
jgi:pimeloyl-ACP methyl ester carboxylesterase